MQTLEFVNSSGPEPWKNKDAKKFVRSHAMKDFRRKQRESTKRRKHSENAPGESTFVIDRRCPDRENALSKQAQAMPCSVTPVTPSDVPKDFSPTEPAGFPSQRAHRLTILPQRSSTIRSVLPPIFPGQEKAASAFPSPPPSVSSPTPSTASDVSNKSERIFRPVQTDFDTSICKSVHEALDAAGANYDVFVDDYFHSAHSYLTIIHRRRFERRVRELSNKARAETAVLLLCMRIIAEPQQSGINSHDGGNLYHQAKNLFRQVKVTKGPSLELLQAGCLLVLYEHNAYLRRFCYETLRECCDMAFQLQLDIRPKDYVSIRDEERRRTYWGLLSLDCIVALHDEKHERPLLLPTPQVDDTLPSLTEDDFDNADDELTNSSTSLLVESVLPTGADGYCRQGQSIRLLCMVLKILREPFDLSPQRIIYRIETLDQLIMSHLNKLYSDCNGETTQYCGPISYLMAGSYLLHEYQLLATMHGVANDSANAQAYSDATVRSKAQIESTSRTVAAILEVFPVKHTPELSPAALFCPYKAAMLSSLLNRINGLQPRPSTLSGNECEQMLKGLNHFSTIWPCTAEYVRLIHRAQSRSLPMPPPRGG